MSGRSAYVRKEKTKVKDGAPVGIDAEYESHSSGRDSSHTRHARPKHFESDLPFRSGSVSRAMVFPEVEGLPYARVRKAHVPQIDVSGIEKSTFRSLVDKKSEGFRNGLAKTFGKKNKHHEEESRPPTSASMRPESHELEATEHRPPVWPRREHSSNEEPRRAGPPQTKLPLIPPTPQLKQWMGSGSGPQPWNQLRRDPELWDPNGDTLVFFSHDTEQKTRPQPSFRLSSHVLEATESQFFAALLREGATGGNHLVMPESPTSSPHRRHAISAHPGNRLHVTPPPSDSGSASSRSHTSYELYFPAPVNQSKTDVLRHQVTTRNVFAVLYDASLVGTNLFQALTDLRARLDSYMPPRTDAAGMIIDYLVTKGMDDVRNQPATAAALLAWSENPAVRWEEGWKETFVHCAGIYNRLDRLPEFRYITQVTRALLERGSLDLQVRVRNCEDRFLDFEFGDMWAPVGLQASPARASFGRLQRFFLQHYQSAYKPWPPALTEDDLWMTRDLVQDLQKDFGALYDYLVNRDVFWDCSEERSGRKWNIVNTADKSFSADSADLPFTDIIVAFDNQNKYPHIPHPYPLVPESMARHTSRENLKATKKSRPMDLRMAERKASLAYTESTNVYILGSDFVGNDLVEAFIGFEKTDRLGEVDPYDARRGRWLLIYGILQTLAAISVDTPNMRYTHDVSYHLSPRLRGTPPWKGSHHNLEEASHSTSYCWKVRSAWKVQPPVILGRRLTATPSNRESAASDSTSLGSHTLTNFSLKSKRSGRLKRDSDGMANSGFSPGVRRLEERSGREVRREVWREGRDGRDGRGAIAIRDFDDDSEF